MNGTRRILSVLFFLFLTLSAIPAGAVTFNNSFSVSRSNIIGSSFINMTNRNTTFCYPSKVGFENIDEGGERAICRVTRGAVVWTLEAILGQNDDANVFCSAHCFNNIDYA
jgi:hypothetical protein